MTKLPVSLLVLAMLLAPSAAMAHDELVSTTPVAGATVEAGSIPIRLTFGETPMDLPFGQGNLIAIANEETGEQLGPACARVMGNDLMTTVNLSADGEYHVYWRVVSNDGHTVSGDYKFKVENHSYYSTDRVGNQCFDDNGNELDITNQQLFSVKHQPTDGMWTGLLWALGAVLLGTFAGFFMVKRRQKN